MKHIILTSLVVAIVGVAGAAVPENTLPFRIGADQAGGNAFPGEIAVIRIHDRALSDAEVAGLAKQKPGEAAALKPAYEWLMGQPLEGKLTIVGKAAAATADGVPCIKLGGGYLQSVAPGINLAPNFVIEGWIRPAKAGVTCRLVDKISPGGSNGFLLDILGDKLRFILGGQTFTRDWDADCGKWIHVAAVGRDNRVDLLVNGRVGTSDEISFTGSASAPADPLMLWWRRPGTTWTEAIVLGNGRLGAMVAGGVNRETLWLNEDTLWSGEPFVPQNPNALKAFPEVRRLLVERKEDAATGLFNQKMLGPYNQCYLPLGTLNLRFPLSGEVQDYRRALNLHEGVATVSFSKDGVTHTRETFTSFPDQALVTRIAADKPGQVSFSANLTSLIRNQVNADGKVLRLTGRCPVHADPHYLGSRVVYDEGVDPKGMTFAVELRAIPDGGKVTVTGGKIIAEGCNAVTLVLVAATSYNGFDKSPSREGRDPVALCGKQGSAAAKTAFVKLRKRHVADFSALMERVTLDLGAREAAGRPINERLRGGFKPEDLPALTALYYQFGRYLLVSSSRPGSQPANLQGIWNRSMNPPWSANWTMNCNANFNYLGVESAALPELHEPFIRLVREWSVDGERTAKNWYGGKGWVGHHNCDLWRNACPVGGNSVWAAFPCGGAWACQDLWEHYAFTLDKAYLAGIWPVLRGSAEFFLNYLFEDPQTRYWVIGPDTNFENGYRKPDGRHASLCMGTTPSNMMIRQLLLNCIEACKILGTDAGLRAQMEAAVLRLPPTVVNARNGEIQEYLDPAYELTGRGSCELLTSWGMVWCDQITPRKTPELAAALRKAYEAPDRRPWVTGQVGSWQGAFPANTFARLGDGDRVAQILEKHFRGIVQGNLTAGFIQSEWEIDGNLGVMAAIGELLMQSHVRAASVASQVSDVRFQIELLPALPKAWKDGSVKGLKARGNITVDIEWKDGKVVKYRLASPRPQPVTVRVNGEEKTILPEKCRGN